MPDSDIKTLSTIKNFYKLIKRSDPRIRKDILLLQFIAILSTVLDVVSLLLTGIFLRIISSEKVSRSEIPEVLLSILDENVNKEGLIVAFSISYIVVLILCGAIRIYLIKLSSYTAAMLGTSLSRDYFEKYIKRPYICHLSSNSSELISGITNHTNSVVVCFNLYFQLLTGVVNTTGILIGLLFFNFQFTLLIGIVLLASYTLTTLFTKNELKKSSRNVSVTGRLQIKHLQEAVGNIKEIIIANDFLPIIDKFSLNDQKYRLHKAKGQFLSQFAKPLIESASLISIVLITIVLTLGSENYNLISTIGTFALASLKILPSMQSIFRGVAGIQNYSSSIEDVHRTINDRYDLKLNDDSATSFSEFNNLNITNLAFKFKKNKILSDINICIEKGEIIGLVGQTGSGKSTLVSIMMGLLDPDEGTITLNERYDLSNTNYLRNWQKFISYVPQDIFLLDSSIQQNIICGSELNHKLLESTCTKAHCSEFINSLDQGFSTLVGERGLRLSGGQRQRLGIARSLYKQKPILIFDEATSALDNTTESLIIDSITQSDDITIIMVAHRLSSLRHCDRIYKLESSTLKEVNYSDLK